MSLLMKALKKAEASKQQAAEDIPPAALALADDIDRPLALLPETEAHTTAVDIDLSALPPQRPRPAESGAALAASRREAAERMAAGQVFAAKQPSPAPRSGWLLILGLSVFAALGIGGYFWWQLQPAAPRLQAPPTVRPAAPPSPAAAASAPPVPTAPAPVTAASVAEKTKANATPAQVMPAQVGAAPLRETPVARPQKPAAPREAALHLDKTSPATLPRLEEAWDALQLGRLEEAQRAYAQVLHSDPRNIDALLGLANIALRQGQSGAAEEYYLRVLEADPDEATAQAGLIGLRGQNDPGLSESRLKTLLSRQPESASLHFSLGNLYARQQRWSEAQQAYFKAFSGEAGNPDYLFNLAVSLDHLRQPRLAAQYYRQALEASANARSLSFDRQQIIQRLAELP